jgi:hypothetical protein
MVIPVKVAGTSAFTRYLNPGAVAEPVAGPARNWFANWLLRLKTCVPEALRVDGVAVMNAGTVQAILPMPLPAPVKVHVVVVQLTPEPENVKAPAVPLICVTPDEVLATQPVSVQTYCALCVVSV